MPGQARSVLLGMEVRPAGRACNCKHNKAHRIRMGEVRLVVKNAGAAAGENGYCLACAEVMISEAQHRLDQLIATLRTSNTSPD
jgi:hypothetical protein